MANWRGDVERLHPAASIPYRYRRASARNQIVSTHYSAGPRKLPASSANDEPYPLTLGCALLSYNAESAGRALHRNQRREFRRRMNTKLSWISRASNKLVSGLQDERADADDITPREFERLYCVFVFVMRYRCRELAKFWQRDVRVRW